MKKRRLACAALAATASLSLHGCKDKPDTPPAESALQLHVPSPEWRDQIIYFVMTDRFNDGDPANNDQGASEFDPADGRRYSGGDLRGLQEKLDYIQGLGATAVWLTPPVANQWWDPIAHFGGYHGYWAQNFMEVDAHLGTLQDYKNLSSALHKAGMYLVQDVVVNHVGNFITYQGGYDATDPTKFFVLNTGSLQVAAPTQPPFNMNDPRNADHRQANIYHWTPPINNYEDPHQFLHYQISDLDDLNTDNPVVRDALRQSFNHWIKEVGVDGFRIDTAFYVPPDFFKDFLRSSDPVHPGILKTAASTGRQGFLAFGEGFGTDKPYTNPISKKIDAYMTEAATGEDLLPSMINFPLYGTAGDVFARGRPTAELGYRIRDMMSLHKRPHLMPTFLDNHDVDRFLTGGSEAGLKQNLLMLMTLPGVPVIYYGTEQRFREQRGSMFKTGFGSEGRDHFDTTSPMYQYIARATALRKEHRVFSRGTPTVLKENGAAPGAFAYKMSHEGTTAFVVFNSSDSDTVLDNLETGLPAGTVLQSLFAIQEAHRDVVVGASGKVTLRLPARAGYVWLASSETGTAPTPGGTLTMTPLNDELETGDFTVSGTSSGLSSFKLVVDGDLAHALTILPESDGSWSAVIDTGTLIDPRVRHSIVAWSEAPFAVSTSGSFFVNRPFTALRVVEDPAGDDAGPAGTYKYPTDATWGSNRQLDLRKVTVSGAGGAMRLDIQVNKITTLWNPPNDFDHVAFTVFIEIPGRPGGVTAMPHQNAVLPNGMQWHYRLRAHGWSNALFSSAGASETSEGTAATPAAGIQVDRATQTVSFILPDASLGRLASLSGVKVYVTTWDYDGGYRPLSRSAQQWAFSGGDGEKDPLVMDDSAVITLP